MNRDFCFFKGWGRQASYLCKLAVVVSIILSPGCGNNMKAKTTTGSPDSIVASNLAIQSQGAGSGASSWRCPNPGSYNLLPISGTPSDIGSFTVCRAQNDPARMRISGITSTRAICIYPAYRTANNASIQLTEQRQCYQIASSPIVVTLVDSRANYLYIVDAQFSNSMDACLMSPNQCPPHSMGSIQLNELPFSL